MKQKAAALTLAAMTVLALTGCSGARRPMSPSAQAPASQQQTVSGTNPQQTDEQDVLNLVDQENQDDQQVDQLLEEVDKELNQ